MFLGILDPDPLIRGWLLYDFVSLKIDVSVRYLHKVISRTI
jgi:hypothetical protein